MAAQGASAESPGPDDAAASTPLVELRGVRADYDGIEVLHGVDLVVKPGHVVAILGPNGAGK
ncbi:MAG: ABC transporter ATP-binding protein, partial [Microthrixaceae bacterium]